MIMMRSALPTSLVVLLLACTNARSQTINGIPDCAKQCALDYLSQHPDCPLTTQPCICGYLSYYSSCIADNCNGTDSHAATQPPIPWYIPEATISIVSPSSTGSLCPLSMTLNTPTFRSGSGSATPTPTETSGARMTASASTSGQGEGVVTTSEASRTLESSGRSGTRSGETSATVTAQSGETSAGRTASESQGGRTTMSGSGRGNTTRASETATATRTVPAATFTGAAYILTPIPWITSLYAGLGIGMLWV